MENKNLKEIVMNSFVFLAGLTLPAPNNDLVMPLREYLIKPYEFNYGLAEELALFLCIRAVYSDKKIIVAEEDSFKQNKDKDEDTLEVLAKESVDYLKAESKKKQRAHWQIREFFKEEFPKNLLT
ncbi:hypothetical protein HYX16_03440 [Candidatus Woesearchaeota archaeon]|nr:hypothetical protein [Candidatus Woesearchaeota archaeon]